MARRFTPGIERTDFLASGPITALIGDQEIVLEPTEFQTKSYGYRSDKPVTITIDGKPVRLSCSLLLVVSGGLAAAAPADESAAA